MKRLGLSLLTFTAITMIGVACSDDDDPATDSGSSVSNAYGGPGSEYTTSFYEDGTFTLTHAPSPGAAVDLTVNGVYTTTDSGFKKLSVTSASGDGAPSAGDTAYGLEIPGFVFLLKPMDNDSEIIPMIVSGGCPTADFTNNWNVTNYGGTDAYSATADIFGVASWDNSDEELTLTGKYALNGYASLTAGDTMSGTCSDGRLTVSSGGNDDAYMWLSQSGAILVKTTHDDGVIVAMPQESYTSANIAGDYIGVVFNEAGSGDTTFPVSFNINSGATEATAYDFTDVDAGTTSSAIATFDISAHNDPADGFMKMDFKAATSAGEEEIICQVMEDVNSSGKNLLFCTGVSPDDTQELFSVILVSE